MKSNNPLRSSSDSVGVAAGNNTNTNNTSSSATTTSSGRRLAHIKLTTINEHFQCGICYGYITDATTITECLHSFCKPCIFHFFGTIDHRCPTCNTSVKDVNESIRSDSRLQRLIYNMVPGLLQEELAKREKYFESVCTDVEEKAAALTRDSWVNLKLYNEQMHASTSESSETSARRFLVRYIQCLAITPVRIIGKLLRNKLSVPLNYKIKLTHEGQLLKDDENLIEVFTCFIYNKDEIFEIKYEIKKIKHRGRSSLRNIENKMQMKSADRCAAVVDSSASQPVEASSRTQTSSSSSLSPPPPPLKMRRKNTTETTRPYDSIMRPLTADIEDRSTTAKKRSSTKTTTTKTSTKEEQPQSSSNQLHSPTSSSSSSSSSSTSARLKNSDFLKVKFSKRSKKPTKQAVASKSKAAFAKRRKSEEANYDEHQAQDLAPPPHLTHHKEEFNFAPTSKDDVDEVVVVVGGGVETISNTTANSFETTREENLLVGDEQTKSDANENSSSSGGGGELEAKQEELIDYQTKEVVENIVEKVEDSVEKDSLHQ